MGSDLSTVLCTRDTHFVPTISQLYTLIKFFALNDVIDKAEQDELLAEFDKLELEDDGRIRLKDGDDIEIEYRASFPYYRNPAFVIQKGNPGTPSFQMAWTSEFDYQDDFEKLGNDLLANKDLAELESRLSTIFGTEVVSAMSANGGYFMPGSRSEQVPSPSQLSLPPFLLNMDKEQIMDMKEARDYHRLVQVLRVKDEELRIAAAKALASIQYDDEIPHYAIEADLMLLLDDPDPSVRKAAVQTQGMIVDAWAIDVIEKGLNDTDEGVREASKAALPEAMSVWRKVSKKEIAKKSIPEDFAHFRWHQTSIIQLDESAAASLGFKIKDVVKCRDRNEEGWTTLYRQIVKRSVRQVKVWKYV